MGCAMGTVKYLLFLANLIFALAGLALLTVGVIYRVSFTKYQEALPLDYNLGLAPTLVIVVGSVIVVISFLGCCGAIRESICMLTTFAVALLAIFIIQIAVGTFAFWQVRDSDGGLRADVKTRITYLVNQYNTTHEVVDLLQTNLHCCGSTGPSDYNSMNGVPASCLPNNGSNEPFRDGCAQKFHHFWQYSIHIIGHVALGIAATEIISAIFALCLSSSIRNEPWRRGYQRKMWKIRT